MSSQGGVGTVRRYSFIAEVALIAGMAATLFIPSRLDNILPWYELSIPLYVRGSFWIVGLSLLPGRYLLEVLSLLRSQPLIIRFSVSAVLSTVLVGAATMVVYFAFSSLAVVPFVLLATTVGLALLNWKRNGIPAMPPITKPSPSHLLLLAGVASSIAIAAFVQSKWRYLIYTDFWVSLLSGVKMVSSVDVYSVYTRIEYPVGYGYIIAGFSSGAGLPLVNTQALMLPLIALNILVFYSMAKAVFGLSDRVSALASIFFAFGGGLGWVFETFINQGKMPFLILSGLLKDMYFFPPFWDGIAYQYKLLAFLMALVAFIAFALSGRLKGEEERRGILLTFVSALLFVWAFLIHMLPALMAPVFLALALFNSERRLMMKRFVLLVVFGFSLFALHELFIGGIYIPLIIDKLGILLSGVGSGRLGTYGAIALGAAGVAASASLLYIRSRKTKHGLPPQPASDHPPEDAGAPPRPSPLRFAKHAIILALAAVYIAGLFFTSGATFTLESAAPFPWFSHVTRYGFLGILAFVGLAFSNWRSNWAKVAIFWSLMAIGMGSIWWGERLNAFLFPPLCLFASLGTIGVLKAAKVSLRSKTNSLTRHLSWAGAGGAVLILATLSLSSFTTGVYWHTYVTTDLVNDDMAESLNWIYHNVPRDDAILSDSGPTLMYYGILALADGGLYFNDFDDREQASLGSTAQMLLLAVKNVRWAYVNDSMPFLTGANEFIRGLQHYGDNALDTGTYSVKNFPIFRLPGQAGGIAVVNRGFFGTSSVYNTFGWLDDAMSGWQVQGFQATSDGEVLRLRWDYLSSPQADPLASVKIPVISSQTYRYLLVHYRNTPETTEGANVTQFMKLEYTSGGSMGFINLPLANNYQTLSYRLPANIIIDRVSISMNNINKENGTFGLEVDYIGFSAVGAMFKGLSPSFLSLAVPAMWGENYTLTDDFDIADGASVLVTTYSNNVASQISNLTEVKTVLLFHSILMQPPWGEGWAPISSAAIQGYYGGKRVIMIDSGSDEIVGNLTGFSTWLLQQIG